jgi:PAS domain S-box-containing protein
MKDGPFFIHDVFAWPQVEERRRFYEEEHIRSVLVLPLHISNAPMASATVTCYFHEPREILAEEHQVARVLADIMSAALSPRMSERLADAARKVSGELDIHRLVQHVTDAATEASNAQFGAFFYNVKGDAGEAYTLYTISGVPREAFSAFPMPRNTAVFAPTFNGTATVRSDDIRQDPRYGKNSPYFGMPAGHLPVVSYLAVPVTSRSGEVLGGLFFGHSDEGVFTRNEEQIVEALAAQAAIGIDNARLYEALSRSEQRYKSLALASPRQGMWIADADGKLRSGSALWNETTGQTADDVRSGSWREVIHPDDMEGVGAAWAESVRTLEPYRAQYRARARDGSYRWFESRAVPVTRADGSVVEWVGTVTDMHDEHFATENLRFLAEASALLASSLDYETTLKSVAQLAVPKVADWCAIDVVDDDGAYRRLAVAHVDPEKVALATALRERYPPNPETDSVARVIRTGVTEWMADIPGELLDASAVDDEHRAILRELGIMSFILVPLRIQDRVLGTISYVMSDSLRRYSQADVTFAEELARRASVAIENARLYGAANAANQAKDDFLATLSHELRTPMTAVLGWARMLKMGLTAEETVEAVDAIEKSATVQMQLIEDILDMSRIMAGKMSVGREPVDLRTVTEAALTAVRPAAAAKGIEIITSYAPQVPSVLGDGNRLQQIVWNLLTNATKFTGRGGTILVRIARSDDNAVITVRDSGTGIDPKFLPHVFDRFRQQDSSTTRAHGGIGLGLAIVRYLVEQHGGTITAESEGTGRGATFRIELPLIDARERSEATSAWHGEELPSLNGVLLLVIDDDAMTRDVVAAILRRCGAEVMTAESVANAYQRIAERVPQVIVCDIAMPREDGYAFVRELRASGSDVPVIALTAFGRPEDRERALRSGFNVYLKKPVDPATLARAVHDLV